MAHETLCLSKMHGWKSAIVRIQKGRLGTNDLSLRGLQFQSVLKLSCNLHIKFLFSLKTNKPKNLRFWWWRIKSFSVYSRTCFQRPLFLPENGLTRQLLCQDTLKGKRCYPSLKTIIEVATRVITKNSFYFAEIYNCENLNMPSLHLSTLTHEDRVSWTWNFLGKLYFRKRHLNQIPP